MCNCGNKRMEYSQQAHAGSRVNTKTRTPVQTPPVYASFEYIGKTALTIRGNITRTEYRFNFPGNRQNIDYRDIPAIMAIPVLKRVK
jgi:hypothetical protein